MSPDDASVLQATIEGVEAVAGEVEKRWGVDRVTKLVSDDLRERFYLRRDGYRRALEVAYENDTGGNPIPLALLDAARDQGRKLQAGWRALDKAATDAGATPLPVAVWEVSGVGEQEGQVIAIVRTTTEAHAVIRDGRHAAVYSLDEIANVLAALPPTIRQAKAVFPGAQVVPARRRQFEPDSEIPF